MTSLHCAAHNGHESTVSLLVSLQANIEAMADVSDNYDVCVFSVTVSVSVSLCLQSNQTPLHWAASNGHESTVSLLVTLQANIEAKTRVSDNYDVYDFSVTVSVSVSVSKVYYDTTALCFI